MLFLIRDCLNKFRIVNGYSLRNNSKKDKGFLCAAKVIKIENFKRMQAVKIEYFKSA